MAQWIRKTHLFHSDEYICSNCGYQTDKPYIECPDCGAKMRKTKYEVSWVDEVETDDLFGDGY